MEMLKAVVTDLNTVDEVYRGAYVGKDGKFFLNVTPVDGFELDNVHGLKTALGAERNTVAQLKDTVKPFEGLDAGTARSAIESLSAFGEITPARGQDRDRNCARLSAARSRERG
jgi:hypothetical protein